MSLKSEKDKTKQLQDKCQSVLNALLRDDDNKYCVDCDSKGPRWASWNIGVFLCIRCAGIHRNLGVHISKVKSVNLDSWTPEQVVSLQQMGNSKARAVYEANLPDNFRRPQNDSSLESFIRAKYEHKKYIAREWVPLPLPKVNWEKEIDEEIEKQKRKKKTTLEKKPLANVEVPQLPKPTNPSPKPLRSTNNTPETKDKQKHNNSSSKDLLGINGEDSFSSFISATPAQAPQTNTSAITLETTSRKEEKTDTAKSEEESFFNQTLPVEKEKTKLDKDSILALYGSGPTIPQFQNPMQVPFQTATGGFQSGLAQNSTGFTAFGGFPQPVQAPTFPVQNGLPPLQGQFLIQPKGVYQNMSKPGSVQFAQAQAPQVNVPMQTLGHPEQNQFQQQMLLSNQFGQFQTPGVVAAPGQSQFAQFGNVAPLSNPNNFGAFMNQTLPQQFGNMALNGGTTTPAPNVWP